MKTRIPLLTLALVSISSCGADPSSSTGTCNVPSDLVGRWEVQPGPSDVLQVAAGCSATQSRCGASFTLSDYTGNPGHVTVTTGGNNGQPNCLTGGTHACGINHDATHLAIDCGLGTVFYIKN
jgi:hypothetical protein